MYTTTNSSVKPAAGTTPVFPTVTGIKQGDNLSTTLFNIFIDDASKLISDDSHGSVSRTSVPSLLYADDLVLLTISPAQMRIFKKK